MFSPQPRGFTLIELMIAVAVVGILAAVAYPAFLEQIRISRRVDAQATLLEISTRQQQMLLDTRRYAATAAGLHVSIPRAVAQNYDISIVVGTAAVPSFIASATPIGTQSADRCGVLRINEAAVKSPGTCW